MPGQVYTRDVRTNKEQGRRRKASWTFEIEVAARTASAGKFLASSTTRLSGASLPSAYRSDYQKRMVKGSEARASFASVRVAAR